MSKSPMGKNAADVALVAALNSIKSLKDFPPSSVVETLKVVAERDSPPPYEFNEDGKPKVEPILFRSTPGGTFRRVTEETENVKSRK